MNLRANKKAGDNMTERTETVTEREYDANGTLTKETITTVVEKRDDQRRYPYTPFYYTGTELTGRTAADTALATSNRLEPTTTATTAITSAM